MRDLQNQLLADAVVDSLLNRWKADDSLVLSDEVLLAAMNRVTPLNQEEWQALLDSPLTLRRARRLMRQQRATAAEKDRLPTAANDAEWMGSRGLLLAADGGIPAESISTDDGLWRLNFLSTGQGYRLLLQLDAQRPEGARIHAADRAIAIFDSADVLMATGKLDADGEFEVAWPFADTSPQEHFVAAGGGFAVEPV